MADHFQYRSKSMLKRLFLWSKLISTCVKGNDCGSLEPAFLSVTNTALQSTTTVSLPQYVFDLRFVTVTILPFDDKIISTFGSTVDFRFCACSLMKSRFNSSTSFIKSPRKS